MTDEDLTRYIAIWGAITGTVGTVAGLASLLLRYRHFRRDKPRLSCEVSFDFIIYSDEARRDFELTLRNIGRRPVFPQAIEYLGQPNGLLGWWRRASLWKLGKFVQEQELSFKKAMSEGVKVDIPIRITSELIRKTVKCRVVDGTGKRWTVPWPTRKKLAEITTYEKLGQWKTDRETNQNHCDVTGFRAGKTYYITVWWNEKANSSNGSSRGETLRFESRTDFDKELAEIRDIQKPLIESRMENRITGPLDQEG